MQARIDNLATLPNRQTTSDLPLKPGSWALDKAHARVGFSVRHLGVSKVRGRFAELDADLVVGSSLEDTAVSASIDLGSIDTGNADRDAHLRSNELLDVEQRPTMTVPFDRHQRLGRGLDARRRPHHRRRDQADLSRRRVRRRRRRLRRHAPRRVRGPRRASPQRFGLSFGALDVLLGQVVKLELDLEFIEPA